jgi:tetraacyldisaccharide 4'-kinase
MLSKLPQSKLFRFLIYLPAKLYDFIIRLRVILYEHEYIKAKQLDKIIISIGNITLGGTGKTPLVEYIAKFLNNENFETAIVSRGYKRQDKSNNLVIVSDGKKTLASIKEAGDEPFMLAEKLKGIKVIVSPNRFEGAKLAIEKLGCDVILLDDGFQHLKLKRDLDIVVIDATNPFGNGEVVPLGKLREPIYGLKRAQMLIVTRSDRGLDRDLLFNVLSNLELNIPIIYAYHDFVGLKELKSDKPAPIRKLVNAKVAVLCALGNPSVFIEDLENYQAKVLSKHIFIDHHSYKQSDIDQVIKDAKSFGVEFIVTTEKDAVKLKPFSFELPIYVVEIKVEFEDEIRLKSVLLRVVTNKIRGNKK